MDTDGLVLIWQLIHLGVYLPAHGHGLPNKNQETEKTRWGQTACKVYHNPFP